MFTLTSQYKQLQDEVNATKARNLYTKNKTKQISSQICTSLTSIIAINDDDDDDDEEEENIQTQDDEHEEYQYDGNADDIPFEYSKENHEDIISPPPAAETAVYFNHHKIAPQSPSSTISTPLKETKSRSY